MYNFKYENLNQDEFRKKEIFIKGLNKLYSE